MEIKFLEKINLASDIWEFRFTRPGAFAYDAGDYVDLSIPSVGAHMLSMSSNPNETDLIFTIRIATNASEFKRALAALRIHDKCYISPAIGNFNLPHGQNKRLLFIALGIGITPYRSLLLEESLPADTTLLYAAKPGEHIYEEVIEKSDVRYIKQNQRVTALQIIDMVADCGERIIYLSGPEPACIQLYTELLDAGIERHRIKLEYFPGYK